MNAIYFPFTCIAKQNAEKLSAIIEQLTIYLPSARSIPLKMEELSASGKLDIRIPVQKDEDNLMASYQEHIEWGKTHQQNIKSYLKHRTESPYLYDDSWSAQIRSDIQNTSKTKSTPDRVFAARLFLQIAQQYDQHHLEMMDKVQSIANKEKSLFKGLKDDDFQVIDDHCEPLSDSMPDLGLYMTQERLSSWYTLMKQDDELPSNILITSSRSVWEHLLDLSPEAEMVGQGFPVHIAESTSGKQCQELAELLSSLQTEEWSSSNHQKAWNSLIGQGEIGVHSEFRIIPDTHPEAFFSRLTKQPLHDLKPRKESFRNTIIGILQ